MPPNNDKEEGEEMTLRTPEEVAEEQASKIKMPEIGIDCFEDSPYRVSKTVSVASVRSRDEEFVQILTEWKEHEEKYIRWAETKNDLDDAEETALVKCRTNVEQINTIIKELEVVKR